MKFNLLQKEAIEEAVLKEQMLLFSGEENPKKEGRLHPIWDLRSLNFTLMKCCFRMSKLKQLFRLVCDNRSEGRIYIYIWIVKKHREFLGFVFGGKAYQFRVLSIGL